VTTIENLEKITRRQENVEKIRRRREMRRKLGEAEKITCLPAYMPLLKQMVMHALMNTYTIM